MSLHSFGDQKMVSRQLNGPRPASLMVNKNNYSKILKKKSFLKRSRSPVIVYLRSPKIIRVSPREFMSLVQRLTGNDHQGSVVAPSRSSSSSSSSTMFMEVDETTNKTRNLVKSQDKCNGKMEYSVTSDMGSSGPSSFSAACGTTGLSVDIYAGVLGEH